MKLSKLQALGAARALFVAVYFPAFAAVSKGQRWVAGRSSFTLTHGLLR
jgi:hypothetical protein